MNYEEAITLISEKENLIGNPVLHNNDVWELTSLNHEKILNSNNYVVVAKLKQSPSIFVDISYFEIKDFDLIMA